MTSEPLLTINAFASAVELAPSTLRFYDEAGLLPPAEVDSRTPACSAALVYSAPDRPVQLVPVEQSRLRVLLMPSRAHA